MSEHETGSPSFEAALARLEEIVARMESGKLSLDESLKQVEEGMKCARICAAKLGEAERRLELLVKKADGTLAWAEQPLDADTGPGRGSPDPAGPV